MWAGSRDKNTTTRSTGGGTRSKRGGKQRAGVILGVVSKFVKCNRVEALDSESKLRGLGMERFRKSRIETLLHFMMVGGGGREQDHPDWFGKQE